MSLIGLYADPHFSKSSSIIVGRQGSFSGRLDNLIESFKWMNAFFKEKGCSTVICLGDFTDSPNLSAEEITAISECNVSDHWFLVGNHCRSDQSGKMNSLSIFSKVCYEPQLIELPKSDGTSFRILLLPYNSEVVDLTKFADTVDVILSHNDIRGYDLGGHVSKSGYNLTDIMNTCKLFINGHLHNGGWVVRDRVMNLGMLSGVNFSSCGGEWEPSVGILDTDTCTVELYENPVAYRFKKTDVSSMPKLKTYLDNLPDTGKYVLQVRLPDTIAQTARKLIDQCSKVVASRVLTVTSRQSTAQSRVSDKIDFDTTSVYDKLRKFVTSKEDKKYSQAKVLEIITSIESKEEGAV